MDLLKALTLQLFHNFVKNLKLVDKQQSMHLH
nr:MAG TPA: hypothetical protein [Caudoviricetes sp.]